MKKKTYLRKVQNNIWLKKKKQTTRTYIELQSPTIFSLRKSLLSFWHIPSRPFFYAYKCFWLVGLFTKVELYHRFYLGLCLFNLFYHEFISTSVSIFPTKHFIMMNICVANLSTCLTFSLG